MIEFNEKHYYLDRSTGYYRSLMRHSDRDYLHRDVWRHRYGNIPHGWEVHHKVEDKGTINPDDLECIPAREHSARHTERSRAFGKANNHHTHRRVSFVCHECGRTYQGVKKPVNRWCSRECSNRFHNRRELR
jgi:hypothetical protein